MTQFSHIVADKKVKDFSKNIHGINKIVIRRLPPTLNSETFLKQVSPFPEFSYFYFMQGNLCDCPFSRAYFSFVRNEDVIIFQEKFDGYVFLDEKGTEFPAVVEYAPFNKIPKAKVKADLKAGTIENDPDYLKFLEILEKPTEEAAMPDAILDEIEAKEKLLKSGQKIPTPLTDFVKKRYEKKQAPSHRDDRRRRPDSREHSNTKYNAEQDFQSKEDQEKSKFLSKTVKDVAPKNLTEDTKTRDRTSEKEYRGKNAYETQKKPRESDSFKRGKGRFPYQKERKYEDYDSRSKGEKQAYKYGDTEGTKGLSHEATPFHSKDARHELKVDEPKKPKPVHETSDYRSKRDDGYEHSNRKDNEMKQRTRYKERPERAIYRPGHNKEKSEEYYNP